MDAEESHRVTVLIADDHGLVRKALADMLGGVHDVEVVAVAASGEEAVALACEHRPNVVVMDLEMPGMDGVAATRAILAAEPETRVLVLTAFNDIDRAERARLAGAVGYLLKDADPKDLVASILASVFATW